MKIAIHNRKGSFSDRWINYCEKQNLNYKIVNAYDSDIIEQLNDCDAFLWHHHHGIFSDTLFSQQLLSSLEHGKMKVFPDFNTAWHFDDKIAQKYLLEKIDAPLVPSYVFYDKAEALEWIKNTSFPKVFKLRRGAGAANVSLITSKRKATKIINTAFSKGFPAFNRIGHFKERINKVMHGKEDFTSIFKGIYRLIYSTEYGKAQPNEKGYAYFQDFIPNNDFDIRVIVIGKRAFALKRFVRKGDFRASGSGEISYCKEDIDVRCIEIAFQVNEKLKTQTIGYDFVFDKNNKPLIVEISYGFAVKPYDPCPGYWDDHLNWHEGKFNPQEWMIEDLIKEIEKKTN